MEDFASGLDSSAIASAAGAFAQGIGACAHSLQRRLADERTTIRALIDATREELALSYLASDRLQIAEIAYMLGFSDPATFSMAFKRWRNVSPSAFRAGARSR